ncbi:hypothetical protein H7F15_14040 [Pontibacter sp. Tf4]|uniref:hypothetical protein n=1 Tax=Pontibacter sp. Tf4 TaxID=2761620 RepID=UPI001627C22B|nr:hypothetical protein [Pontibacter sp. Tf4]MBB6612166.1 hypothetical protein [Pontibacter sp. Tf4]
MEAEKIPEFNYIKTYIDERELIDSLIVEGHEDKINYNLFSNLIYQPVGDHEYNKYKGFFIGKHLLRESLGFDKTTKPGDFDIIIIPFSGEKVFFERSCAIEVKVVRPTRRNPKRNANSIGEEQVYGLINDGFPLVGLIHICMPEPLNENEKIKQRYITGGVGENASKVPLDEREAVDVLFDHLAIVSLDNQMRRLVSRGFPKYVGLKTVGLNIEKDYSKMLTFSFYFNTQYEAGYFNPRTSAQTISKIRTYWEANKERFIKAKK